jgi:hypothetical protein
MHRTTSAILIVATAIPIGCERAPSEKAKPDLQSRKQHIQQRANTVTDESLARKHRSIAVLKNAGVRWIEHLPGIETEDESKRRTTEEVAIRAMALCIVAVKGEGLEQETIDKLVAQYRLADTFTPKEAAFIKDPNPSQHDRVQFAWRYECYWVMLWALGYVDSLDTPGAICDVPKAVAFLRDNGREGFLRKAKLRSQKEILDAADLIYRYHWAVVDARVNGGDSPEGVEGGVVMERHYALNWLIGYMDQEWDDISTDT